jgi:HEAT repeat protein
VIGSAGGNATMRRLLLSLAGALAVSCDLASAADEAHSPEKLAAQLASADRDTRREAAYQLNKLGAAAKPALPALIKALDDPDKQVWSFSVSAIAALGAQAKDAIPALLDDLHSKKSRASRDRERRQALFRSAYALTRIGPEAIPPLIEGLKDEDPGLRAGSAKALGGMGPAARTAIPALVENLSHSDAEVRREVVDALGLIGAETIPALRKALAAADPAVRSGAALAICQLVQPAHELGPAVADTLAKEADPNVRAALVTAVPKVGIESSRAIPLLISALKSDQEPVRRAAVTSLMILPAAKGPIVANLAALLKDPDPAVSQRAAVVLGRFGGASRAAAPALLELATQQKPPAPAYLEALGQIGPSVVPEILRAIEKENPDLLTRDHWSIKCLQALGGPAAPALTHALSSPSVAVRLVAARGLGELGPAGASVTDSLAAGITDADPRVRATVLAGLVSVRMPAAKVVPKVQAAFKDPSPAVRLTAAQLVPYLGADARTLAPSLLAALNDPEPAVRGATVQALGSVGAAAEPAVARLLEVLASSDASARTRIIAVFGAIGPGAYAAVPELKKLAQDPSPEVRGAAVSALSKVDQAGMRLPVLLAALGDRDLSVRRAAAEATGEMGDKARDATAALTELVQHAENRDFALEALRQIQVRSVPHLLQMLAMSDAGVRAFACERLARIGPEAKEAIPALETIEREGEPNFLRRAARDALRRIQP